MRDERFARKPLLYIHQPTGDEVRASMQYQYRSSKVKQHEKKETRQTSAPRRKRRKASFYHHELEEKEDFELDGEHEKADEIEKVKENKKKFKDMTVEEQIDYLIERPSYAPEVVAEFKTEEQSFHGTLNANDEQTITIRSGKRKVMIEKDKIIKIRLVGL